MNDQYRTPYYSGLLAYMQSTVPVSHAGSQTRQGCTSDFKAFLGENVFLLDLTEVQGLTTCISPLAFSEKLWTYWQMPTVQKNRSF